MKTKVVSLMTMAALALSLTSLPAFSAAPDVPHNALLGADVPQNPAISSEIEKKLDKKQFKDVRATVNNSGVVTLTGTVALFSHKQDAADRVRKALGVTAVDNRIEIVAPPISDQELMAKLSRQLTYDRVGYWNVFNAITLKVENGTATLGGHARTPWDRDSAARITAAFPGVKNVVDNIQVDPLSNFDDTTRFALLRAIYGFDMLSKYAMDPAKPIRISVQNGVVSLYGTVESTMDKQMAYMRARMVPNVFEVRNFLEVATSTRKP